ncbi:MAG: M12 family metallo-peptidase [Phycisphaerales bacterium]|nr:M12 family metallo-peptidase [Phycisphaerales bacterium]
MNVFTHATTVIVWSLVAVVSGGIPEPEPVLANPVQVRSDALATLGLTAGEVVEIAVPTTASVAAGAIRVSLSIEGQPQTVELNPITVRSAEYSVKIQLADGSYADVEPAPERTFRGTVVGLPDAIVAATLDGDGLHALALMPNGTRYWIEPVPSSVAGATPGQHIVYRDEDVVSSGGTCILGEHAAVAEQNPPSAGGVAADGLHFAELAIDADYEYFQRYGTVAAVETQVSSVINTMNVQYERDLSIRHLITTIIVRTAEPDPYYSSDPETLLDQFRLHWVNYQTGVHRDMAQLFTGKDLSGTTIGIAWLAEVCTTLSYSVVESDANGCPTFACKTDLSAHELGHNWGADHCGGIDCFPQCLGYTMNCTIQSANRFHPVEDIPEMIAYRDSRSCLDIGDELRRVIISVSNTALAVGQSIQLTATADFRYGPDQDVTSQAAWTVDRPDFAAISPSGLLTAIDADAESCVLVDASYTYSGQTKTAQKQFTFTDPTVPLQVVSSEPPNNAIDARQPSDPDGNNRTGWSSVVLTLNGEPCTLTPSRFVVSKVGGVLPPPTIVAVEQVTGSTVRLTLNGPIEPGAWTTVEDAVSGTGVRLGFLPGDVNGDGTAAPVDILALIDSLNGVGPMLPLWATDIDRSGVAAPADILSLIDLLNGAGAFNVWNGARLP